MKTNVKTSVKTKMVDGQVKVWSSADRAWVSESYFEWVNDPLHDEDDELNEFC
jgi:hypothetical protein